MEQGSNSYSLNIRAAAQATKKKIRESIRKHQEGDGFSWDKIAEYSGAIRWAIAILTLYLAAEVTAKFLGLWIPTEVAKIPKRAPIPTTISSRPKTDFQSVLRRNMFNVEGFVPDPFDQGQLDCLSQATLSKRRITLLATIVMDDEMLSTALVEEPGKGFSIAVKKDDVFMDGQFVAVKIDRKKLCFQVRQSQDFEYIEIPENVQGPNLTTTSISTGGITRVDPNRWVVPRSLVDSKLSNVNEILKTAKANPYIKNGQFEGFIIQSVEDDSVFKELGVEVGDIIQEVNNFKLNGPGKGIEAFQAMRNVSKIELQVLRNGQKQTLSYDISQ